MSWQPTTILRFERSVPNSTGVARVVTDKGAGYLKAMGNPEGEHALACEWVGTNLARLLGLFTFDFAVIEVTAEDEVPLGTGGFARPGPAYLSRAEPGQSWGGSALELRHLANPLHLTRLVLLDTWIRNADRYPPTGHSHKPNRNNVFLSAENAPAGKLLLKAMDYTQAFTNGRPLSPQLATIDCVKDEGVYGRFPEFEPLLDRLELTRAVSDLKLITRERIAAIVSLVPTAWQVDQVARDALTDFIMRRAEYVADDLPGRLWPQQLLGL